MEVSLSRPELRVYLLLIPSLEGSSLQVALKAILWEPICAVSYAFGALGLFMLFNSRGELPKIASGLALCAVPFLWIRFWRGRLGKIWDAYVREFLEEGDMVDIGRFYSRNKPKGDDDGGVSAFWVVEVTEGQNKRVVGCIGLGTHLARDFTHLLTIRCLQTHAVRPTNLAQNSEGSSYLRTTGDEAWP